MTTGHGREKRAGGTRHLRGQRRGWSGRSSVASFTYIPTTAVDVFTISCIWFVSLLGALFSPVGGERTTDLHCHWLATWLGVYGATAASRALTKNQKWFHIPLFHTTIPYHSKKNQKSTKYQYDTGKSQTLARSARSDSRSDMVACPC